jgi:hypothetical protein
VALSALVAALWYFVLRRSDATLDDVPEGVEIPAGNGPEGVEIPVGNRLEGVEFPGGDWPEGVELPAGDRARRGGTAGW